MNVLESKEVTINGNYYVITAMDAVEGLDFITKMISNGGVLPEAKEIRQLVVKYVKLGGKPFTEKSFGTHFSRNYNELQELFEEFMSFNFGDEVPNDGSDTSVEEDTSEG